MSGSMKLGQEIKEPNLTSFEFNEEGVPNTIITDNTGGILMQEGKVDMCIVGTDRTLFNGDVCNKVGTYLKALAAKDNNVPFYVALQARLLTGVLTIIKKFQLRSETLRSCLMWRE